MIAEVHFENFKALRCATVRLGAFNLLIGPNGSGKTSLIQALLRLRTLAALPATTLPVNALVTDESPRMQFRFAPPFAAVRVTLGCASDGMVCDVLAVEHAPDAAGEALWETLRARLRTMRGFLLDHYAMAVPAKRSECGELTSNGGNLAAVLAAWRETAPATLRELTTEFQRIVPEFDGLDFRTSEPDRVELLACMNGERIPAESLSQGTLYLLAVLTLALSPHPPAVVCLEEADRGVHPRMLREVRDALYRLSYPVEFGLARAPVQVITTTHSPYLLDLFRDQPDEVILSNKSGRDATFTRLSDREDLRELLGEASLGDLWFSGILGGTPDGA